MDNHSKPLSGFTTSSCVSSCMNPCFPPSAIAVGSALSNPCHVPCLCTHDKSLNHVYVESGSLNSVQAGQRHIPKSMPMFGRKTHLGLFVLNKVETTCVWKLQWALSSKLSASLSGRSCLVSSIMTPPWTLPSCPSPLGSGVKKETCPRLSSQRPVQ